MRFKKNLPFFYFVVAAVLLQTILTLMSVDYLLTQITITFYYGLLIIGLTVLMGYAGQISMGHSGFFAIGGYTAALLTTYNLIPHLEKKNALVVFLSDIGLTVTQTNIYGKMVCYIQPLAVFIFAIILTVGISLLIAIPVLRLKGHYLAMATLGFGIIIEKIVTGTKALGEADGLAEVPAFKLFAGLEISAKADLKISNYYIAVVFLLIGLILLFNVIRSRTGRALRSLHGGDDVSGAMGINPYKYKVMAFVLSAVFASIAGIFLTHYNGGIGPSEVGIMKSIRYVAIVAAGGMANIWGTLTMCVVLNFLSLRGVFGSYDDAVFGLILILIMLFAPNGITSFGVGMVKEKAGVLLKKFKKQELK